MILYTEAYHFSTSKSAVKTKFRLPTLVKKHSNVHCFNAQTSLVHFKTFLVTTESKLLIQLRRVQS